MKPGSSDSDRGFSLVELMVVVAIMAILTSIAFASYHLSVQSAQRAVCTDNQRKFDTAITLYVTENSGAPPATLDDVEDFLIRYQVARTCPSDGRDLVYDPVTTQVTCTFPSHER